MNRLENLSLNLKLKYKHNYLWKEELLRKAEKSTIWVTILNNASELLLRTFDGVLSNNQRIDRKKHVILNSLQDFTSGVKLLRNS